MEARQGLGMNENSKYPANIILLIFCWLKDGWVALQLSNRERSKVYELISDLRNVIKCKKEMQLVELDFQ